MTNPTSNFGWQMPTATDLLTDLPADFAVFGQAVDTSMADLKGGTTGQILSKATSTDMDFTWITNDVGDITAVTAGTGISGGGTSGAVTITNSMATTITTAGDLIKGTGSGTFDRLGIGSSGQVLTVSAGAPAWVSPAGGGKVLQVVYAQTSTYTTNNTTTFTDTTLTATITPTLATSKILVILSQNACGKLVNNQMALKLLRGSTDILQITDNGANTAATSENSGLSFSASYLDSPATTSATTYKTQFKSTVGGQFVVVQNNTSNNNSTITLLEIGA
jgi:hypothetical protein